MASWPRHLAPAGSPISLSDLLHWGYSALSTENGTEALRQALRGHFGDLSYFPTSTGRAGLTLLLRAMRRLAPSQRDEVLIPAYTCYSVPASAIKAGLKVRLTDIDPGTLDFAPDALERTDFSRVLTIVATNLYGLPSDLPAIAEVARAKGVYLIDDAAQAMGASIAGRPSGLWGDAGLFSFDKGKNVSAIDGGVVVTASEALATALRDETAVLPSQSLATCALNVAKILAYFTMLRPSAYGVALRLPGLGLGRTTFATDFPLARPDPRLAGLAAIMLSHLQQFTSTRTANALALVAGIGDIPGVQTITPRLRATPAYLRLPILLATRQMRDAVVAALTSNGVGASGSYPACLADVSELQGSLVNPECGFAGGRKVASCIATLPTHPFVTPADTRSVVSLVGRGVRIACAA